MVEGTIPGELIRNGIIQAAYRGIRTQALEKLFKPHREYLFIVEILTGYCKLNYHLGKLVISKDTACSSVGAWRNLRTCFGAVSGSCTKKVEALGRKLDTRC